MVASVQLLDAGSVDKPNVDGTPDATMPVPCENASWVALVNRVVNEDHCRIKLDDRLLALVNEFRAQNPTPGETRVPERCEPAGAPIYQDQNDPSVYIICQAVCESMQVALTMELDRVAACMDAGTRMNP